MVDEWGVRGGVGCRRGWEKRVMGGWEKRVRVGEEGGDVWFGDKTMMLDE